MNKQEIKQTVEALIAAPSCCAEAKAAGKAYLAAIGTADEKRKAQALLDELKEDVTPIDGFIGFTGSPAGAKVFGAERAKAMHQAAVDAKAKGSRYCICDACQAGGKLLDHQADLLA